MSGKTPEEIIEQIVALRKQGKTYAEIREETGLEVMTISAICKLHGLKNLGQLRHGVNQKALQKAAKMAELRRDGKTLEEIGAEFGVTREYVRKLLKKYFPNERFKGVYKGMVSEPHKRAFELFKSGERRMWVIREKCGITTSDGLARRALSNIWPEFKECQTKTEYEREQRKQKLKELLGKGFHPSLIAKKMKTTEGHITQEMARFGLKSKVDGNSSGLRAPVLDKAKAIKEVKKALKTGKPILQVARDNEWPIQTLYNYKKKILNGEL